LQIIILKETPKKAHAKRRLHLRSKERCNLYLH